MFFFNVCLSSPTAGEIFLFLSQVLAGQVMLVTGVLIACIQILTYLEANSEFQNVTIASILY